MSIVKQRESPIFQEYIGWASSHQRLRAVSATLSAAQVQAMYTTPVTVIPAPQPGTGLYLVSVAIEVVAGTTPFTSGGVVELVYHAGAVNLLSNTLPAATVCSALSSLTMFTPAATAVIVPAATAIDITNATGAFATGNGQLLVFALAITCDL